MRYFSGQQYPPPPPHPIDSASAAKQTQPQPWRYLLTLVPLQLILLFFALPPGGDAEASLIAAGSPIIGGSRTLLVLVVIFAPMALFILAMRRMQRLLRQHAETLDELHHSRERLRLYAKQTEQFSLSAAAMLSIKDETRLFAEISQAIVTYSDFSRVLISLFSNQPPFRQLIGHAGVAEEIVAQVKATDLHKSWYDQVFSKGLRLGRASYYIPHTMKNILNQEATFYGTGSVPETFGWHPEDNLFVRMDDENGEFLGVISVDSSKSGQRPTDEIIRPLEIYASLISQILALRRNQKLRDELQERLRQAQKMEVIGKLTGGIAHDFNNILAIIIGNVELAQLQLADNERSRVYLEEIQRASFRARDIVRHLLAYSGISPNALQLLPLAEVLGDAITLLRSSLPSDIVIVENIHLEKAAILVNPSQFHEMLLNLGSNANHAMENGGGTLTISATVETVEHFADMNGKVLAPGRYAVVVVADTGEGITEELLPRIFDPYFTTKEFGKGCGMGLTIVHGIVLGHGGAVRVTSTPGQGSSFSVYLPIHLPAEAVAGSAVPVGGNQQLLLVDDEYSPCGRGYRSFSSPVERIDR
jgi:signal transduction histidine kinase